MGNSGKQLFTPLHSVLPWTIRTKCYLRQIKTPENHNQLNCSILQLRIEKWQTDWVEIWSCWRIILWCDPVIGKSRLTLSPPVHQGAFCIAELRDWTVDIHSAGVAVPLQRVIVTAFWEKIFIDKKYLMEEKYLAYQACWRGRWEPPRLLPSPQMQGCLRLKIFRWLHL